MADRLSVGTDIPSVNFQGQKVLVTFGKLGGDKIGPIFKGIYRALMTRQTRENMDFRVLRLKSIPASRIYLTMSLSMPIR